MIGRDLSPALSGRVAAWIFALAPAVLFALTWAERFTPFQQMARAFALPVLAAQLAIVVVSFAGGWRLGRLHPLPLALILALGVVAWVTAATAQNPTNSLIRTGAWTVQLLFALAIVNLSHQRMLDPTELWRATMWGFLLVFALLIAFVATTDQTPQERVWELPAFGHIRWFGYYAAGIAGLAAAGFLRRDRFALFVAAMAFALASWTGTRGMLVAALVGFSACAILFGEFRSIAAGGRLLLCVCGGLFAAFVLHAMIPLGQGLGSLTRFGLSGRVEIWVDTLEHFRLRPWFGWGEGQVSAIFQGRPFVPGQPHNIGVQVLHAWGVVGAVLCLSLVVWFAPRFLKARREQAAPFQCGALVLAAYSFVDGTLYYVQSLSLFVLCCAVVVAIGQNSAGELRSPPLD